MTRGTRIGLAMLGAGALVVAANAPAWGFTLAETGAALGKASGLAASNGMSGAHTRDVVQRRLAGLRADAGAPAAGAGGCGGRSWNRTAAKAWRRAGDPGSRTQARTWKRRGESTAHATRVAWTRAADRSRCR